MQDCEGVWEGARTSCSPNPCAAADDDSSYTCQEAYTDMYSTCNLFFSESGGSEIPVATAIAGCEAGRSPYALTDACGLCVVDNYSDCTAMENCLTSCVGGADDDNDTSPTS